MGTTCGICGHGYEDVLHVLGDCTPAKVSNSRIHKSTRPSIDPSLRNNWIRLNMDGAIRVEDTFATAGGFLQDCNGGGLLASVDIWAIVQF
ncbi:hypothetical protein Goshw_029126 [Gossypium schwendimanii]|uniref:RNase H type-1 domain-containing protein n=1 Tax=Gossypium schwendimanii TaxID=34291 RepID=A0A7J9KP49_GOSSC|nr:hypothetical protein [Gossypium schwendimanii]